MGMLVIDENFTLFPDDVARQIGVSYQQHRRGMNARPPICRQAGGEFVVTKVRLSRHYPVARTLDEKWVLLETGAKLEWEWDGAWGQTSDEIPGRFRAEPGLDLGGRQAAIEWICRAKHEIAMIATILSTIEERQGDWRHVVRMFDALRLIEFRLQEMPELVSANNPHGGGTHV
jgi:hypothetical protein